MDSKAEAIQKAWGSYSLNAYASDQKPRVNDFEVFRAGFNAGAESMHRRHMLIHKQAEQTIGRLQELMWGEDK